jgi:hypothetical protein
MDELFPSITGDVHLKITTAAALALSLFAAPRPVSAQTMQWTDKGFITVSGGVQTGSHDLATNTTFPLYDETATVTSSQKVKSGGLFDIGGAYRVWGKNLLAGVNYSHVSSESDINVNASLPHPVFFDRPRTITTSVGGAKHSENTVHIDAIYMIPVANKLDIAIFGGPSVFNVTQDSLGTPTVTETADPNNPTLNLPLVQTKKAVFGGNIGVDVQYLVYKKYGVGMMLRYAGANVTIPGATEKLGVGGFQIAFGGRFRL